MKKYAVIDIGSNSVRLMFVADGKVLYKRLETTRLGEGLATRPILKTEAIKRTATAVAKFYALAKSEGAQEIAAFATAAVRTSENGRDFVACVKELCGLTVEVLSGEAEAKLGAIGALGGADGGIVDVGGASTEIVVKKQDKLVFQKSVDIGVVRLKDACGREEAKLQAAASSAAKSYGKVPFTATVYAIGGTATTLAALKLGLREYRSDVVTGTKITAGEMSAFAAKLLATPVEEIAKYPCMPTGRADVLAGGAVLLATLMRTFSWEELVVSDRDNLEGYAITKGWIE